MKLITKTLEKRFQEIGDQSEEKNPLVIAKFFNPAGQGTWYATEYDAETDICFGYVTGLWEDEWGYFSIKELQSVGLPFGLRIERDIFFQEIHFDELMKQEQKYKLDLEQNRKEELKLSKKSHYMDHDKGQEPELKP